MTSKREMFLRLIGQTSRNPSFIEVDHAKGVFIYDVNGEKYFDLASGIGPNILGHRHHIVQEAVESQIEKYWHTMVYGEHAQSPQIALAEALVKSLPEHLESVYFHVSGSEAVEGALKLAKLITGRSHIMACANAYHGSTMAAESLRSDIDFVQYLAPGMPGIRHIEFNKEADLEKITQETAAVILETVQAESGLRIPRKGYLEALRERCDLMGCKLILDEIQMGLGRTGKLFAFEHFGVEPDILVLGKALGGGMPLSCFIARKSEMDTFTHSPALAHLTTFGGHPVSCAAGLATVEVLFKDDLIERANPLGEKMVTMIDHPIIKEIRQFGFMVAIDFATTEMAIKASDLLLENGIICDILLFSTKTLRFAPPLTISDNELKEACQVIVETLDQLRQSL